MAVAGDELADAPVTLVVVRAWCLSVGSEYRRSSTHDQ
jgi:hypothetical protein